MNASGNTQAVYTYDAWGKVLSVKDSNGNDITSWSHIANLNPLRYRGYYYDTETGWYYLQSRYYDPVIHRFINADSYASTDATDAVACNMFAYCGNNPANKSDADGNRPVWERRYDGGASEYTDSCSGRYAGQANCYAYAFKMSTDPRTGKAFTKKPQPGEFGGNEYTDTLNKIAKEQDGTIYYEQVKDAIISGVKSDGTKLGFSVEEVDDASCPTSSGQWVVALAFDPESGDYHWWRRMSNRTWEHKPGPTPIRKYDDSGAVIYDPGRCNRGNYTVFFGYFLITPES